MNKTPAEWRAMWSEYRKQLRIAYRGYSGEVARVRVANAVLGYAMARGWFNV